MWAKIKAWWLDRKKLKMLNRINRELNTTFCAPMDAAQKQRIASQKIMTQIGGYWTERNGD